MPGDLLPVGVGLPTERRVRALRAPRECASESRLQQASSGWSLQSQSPCGSPGSVSAALFYVVDKIFGLRPTEEAEREGLDLTEHGERAYNY